VNGRGCVKRGKGRGVLSFFTSCEESGAKGGGVRGGGKWQLRQRWEGAVQSPIERKEKNMGVWIGRAHHVARAAVAHGA
jgi:hypothetical protein